MRLARLVMLLLIISSCEKKTDDRSLDIKRVDSVNANGVDSLAIFHENDWMTFLATNGKDQIALLLMRDTMNIFKYRIELLRKWKGLPHDYGELRLKKVESDGAYVFEGGNYDCAVVLRMYGAERVGRDYIKIERDCKNNSLDINANEFKRLIYKG
jgi:hypothetical protein